MNKLFFDDLLKLDDLEKGINKYAGSTEEKHELWGLVDDLIHTRVLEKILDHLPEDSHSEFLTIYHECPHDEVVIFAYLNKKTGKNMEGVLKMELEELGREILKELGLRSETTKETEVSKK